MNLFSLAIGVGTKDSGGNWLEVFYPAPLLNPSAAISASITSLLDYAGGNVCMEPDQVQQQALLPYADWLDRKLAAERYIVVCILENDSTPASVPEVYLKLHLLSHRLVLPHGVKLDGMFGVLPNVAWTSEGAIAISELPQRQLQARLANRKLSVDSVDKFPKMTDYVVPAGVRIADTARVRLGAYLGEGTTIMHEGFVNFNAGTAGEAMIEGRITAGVFVGRGTDLGGGCSILGTLSGGGKEVISIGQRCLIGANAGLGISLGDDCRIEAGLFLTAGTKVSVLDEDRNIIATVKARELSGKSNMLFWRNSRTGAVECLTNKSSIELNSELHAHN